MADETQTTETGAGEQPETGHVFSQEQVDRIVGERVKRERDKYDDYDDLKGAAAKLAQLEEAQLTEVERANKAREAAEQAAKAAMDAANTRLMRASFIAEAAKAGAAHPEDAYALANKAGVEVGDDGNVAGVSDAVKALVDAGRLVMAQGPRAASLDGGAGSGDRSSEKARALTPEQLHAAGRMGLTPEEYAKGIT